MSLPPNFGRAVDLSSLGKPKAEPAGPMPGIEITPENLTNEFLSLSKDKPVVLICWSPRSPESQEVVAILGKLALADQGSWVLGRVDVDAQPQVAQALQTRAVPFAVAIINEQMVPLFEQPYPEEQIRMVIDKVLALASEQGVGGAPTEKIEPEEEEAIAALDAGDYAKAEAAYKKLLARKPNDNFAILGLAQTQLMARTDGIDGANVMKEASAHPDNIDIQLQCADIEIVSGYLEPAFARLLRLIPLFDGAEKKLVKDRLIELFALVDPADPRVIKARAALANALF
ncbi:tetratricopeptide repeat protein [Candidatus Planktophila lacus]|jgi:putative thioredoxin|uniref:Thioredoxin n=1 Tax=Candidatus Planktophila lacus TaxID=1884913 RepID=A0AAC9YPW6_9ACTN|nr:tetratricopeptide repeat protein [Candidatus Planktophila lacus]ASY10252.1 putative thioredoxin [Candidatus Planktophila lacus]